MVIVIIKGTVIEIFIPQIIGIVQVGMMRRMLRVRIQQRRRHYRHYMEIIMAKYFQQVQVELGIILRHCHRHFHDLEDHHHRHPHRLIIHIRHHPSQM